MMGVGVGVLHITKPTFSLGPPMFPCMQDIDLCYMNLLWIHIATSKTALLPVALNIDKVDTKLTFGDDEAWVFLQLF